MEPEKEFIPLNLKPREDVQELKEVGGSSYFLYFLLFLFFFVLFMVVSEIYLGKYRQIHEKRDEILVLQKQIQNLENENRKLLRTIEELKTDEGQEMLARKKLKLIKPDEKIVEWEFKP